MKRFLIVLLLSCGVSLLTACSNSNVEVSSETSEQSATETAVPDIEQQKTENDSEQTEELEQEGNSEIEKYFSKANSLVPGKEIHAENVANLSFNKAYWSKDIRPKQPKGSYSYMKEQEGYQYLVIEGIMENLQEEKIGLSTVQVGDILPYLTLVSYKGEIYLAKMMATTEEEDDMETKIEPHKKVNVCAFALIPEEISGEDTAADLLLGFSDFQETIYSNVASTRIEWELCKYLYKMSFDVPREE